MTVVNEEAERLEVKSKVVEVIENDNTDKLKDKENEKENGKEKEVVGKVRASGRTRRPAVKKAEAEDALVAAGEKVGVEVLPGAKGRSRRRAVGRR